jgi:hypothetical protein
MHVKWILATLQTDPELFRFKSKGLLVSSHKVEELERKRFRIEISKEFVDGVLDGGHNLFALGLFLLESVMDPQEWKRIKDWEQFDKAWERYRDDVTALAEGGSISADVGVELLYPSATDEDTLTAFDDSAFVISQARSLNAQVADHPFMTDLADDVDFTQWISVWFYEETKHPQALLRWLHHLGVGVDDKFIMRGRATSPFMKSRMGTLVTNISSEMVASAAYTRLYRESPEPVLALLLWVFGVGLLVLIPALVYLLRTFKGPLFRA